MAVNERLCLAKDIFLPDPSSKVLHIQRKRHRSSTIYIRLHSSSGSAAVLEKAVRVLTADLHLCHIKIPDVKKNDVDVAVLWLKVKLIDHRNRNSVQ